MIQGPQVIVGGETLTVPPLSFTAVRRFSSDGTFAKLDAILDGSATSDASKLKPDVLDALMRVVLAALQRNYPDMAERRLEGLLDKESEWGAALGRLLLGVMGITFKAKEKKQGEP